MSSWAMFGGCSERAMRKGAGESKEASLLPSLWDFRRGKVNYEPNAISHFFPQCVLTHEVVVLLSHDRYEYKEPHITVLDAQSGKFLFSHSHYWENSLSHSPVTNGVDLWCLSQNQIFRYSLLEEVNHPANLSFPVNCTPASNAAPLWFHSSDELPSKGLLCYATDKSLWFLDRDFVEVCLFELPREFHGVMTCRTPAACWPWLFLNTAEGRGLLLKYNTQLGAFQTAWEGQLPGRNPQANTIYSPPVFAGDSFWIELLAYQEQPSVNPLLKVSQSVIQFSTQDRNPKLISIPGSFSATVRDIELSFRYPMQYEEGRGKLLLYSGISADAKELRLFDTNTGSVSRLIAQNVQNLSRYKSCVQEQQLFITETGNKLRSLNLLTGQCKEHVVLNPLNKTNFDGTPVVWNNRMILPFQDRYLQYVLTN